jgi:hypothetical protein
MKEDRPSEAESRVVPLRRPAAGGSSGHPRIEPPVEDLSRFERREEDDDYRHRMITNVIALVFTAMLVVAGVWVANKIAEMRKNQDCVLSGRRSCSPIEIPSADR